jgi:putative hydrolase
MRQGKSTREKILAPLQRSAADQPAPFDFHMHTNWTDGENSSLEMYQEAVRCGLKTILFSEHARKSSDWFGKFAKEIRALPQLGCVAHVGVEVKALDFEGNIDCSDQIVEECDLVMGSVHRFPGEEGIVKGARSELAPKEIVDTEFRLASAMLDNPTVDILGHAFGMCYRRFGIAPPRERFIALIEKAARTRVAFEVNAHYHPDPWFLIRACRDAGATISLGSNAHVRGEVGRILRVLRGQEPPWNPSVP